MPLLQVRECPDELYAALNRTAQEQNRSIAQQTVVQLRKSFEIDANGYKTKRARVLYATETLNATLPEEVCSPAQLLREDRDMTPSYLMQSLKKES